MKRGHWQAVIVGTRMLAGVAKAQMTPARFDLLYALRLTDFPISEGWAPILDSPFRGMPQSGLTRTLGVSRQVVSRMVIQLEAWGWVLRDRCDADSRTKVVRLSSVGRTLIEQAMRVVLDGRLFLLLYERAFARWTGREDVCGPLDTAWQTIDGIARELGDRSSLEYEKACPFSEEYHLASLRRKMRPRRRARAPARARARAPVRARANPSPPSRPRPRDPRDDGRPPGVA